MSSRGGHVYWALIPSVSISCFDNETFVLKFDSVSGSFDLTAVISDFFYLRLIIGFHRNLKNFSKHF
jgi:hypothetical protein